MIMGDLLILGDVYLNFKSEENAIEVNKYFSDRLLNTLKFSFCIGNLESPITSLNQGIIKNGPNLKAKPAHAPVLQDIGVKAVSLCNNHILDFGPEAIQDTMNTLSGLNIAYFGICNELDYSNNFYVTSIKGHKVGFYTTCENEFSGYKKDTIGANVLESPRVFNEISECSKKCDHLIVLFHGGMELYRYPTPNQQTICRSFIDSGADLVISQHSHCVGCEEDYKGKKIIYGQGNFYFGASDIEEYKTAILISVSLSEKELITDYIPINLSGSFLDIAEGKTGEDIINGYANRSKELNSEGSSKLFYEKRIKNNYGLLYAIFNKGKWYSRLDRHLFKSKLIKRYSKKHIKKLLFLLNYINCETHRELIVGLLKEMLDEKTQ